MFNYSGQMLRAFVLSVSDEALHEKVDAMASTMGGEGFVKHVAKEVVERTQPQMAVPEIYRDYRPLVRDGVEFFLSKVDRRRLTALAVSQLKMDPDADPQERLLALAKQFPTLHKLGQIIARNPHMDPSVKKWLVHLENGCYGTPIDGIMERIGRQLEHTEQGGVVDVQPTLLSEASVGAVFRFIWRDPSSRTRIHGVVKVLKPGIRKHLEKEVTILQKTADFFDKNRDRYSLKGFKFLEVFQEVREMLEKEIDLASEQVHLLEAARFYRDMDRVRIPQLLPFCTDTMTAMEYLDGPKITDADLTPQERRQGASDLFEALICMPLFSPSEQSLFHGDPHAGNILFVRDSASGRSGIGLLDWSLAGRLTKRDRIKTIQLIQALHKKDLSRIRRSVNALAICGSFSDAGRRRAFRLLVLDMVGSADFDRMPLVKRTFKLMEALSLEGFVFPADLMLFRKAIFTLEGVLFDLCPDFDMDEAITQYMGRLLTWEIPARVSNLLFPLADRPENYPSLISNSELQSLLVHQYFDAFRTSSHAYARYFSVWRRLLGIPF
jgi:ubiquinone biosynthesis protein